MFENEFTYLRHNGIEGAKILIVQRMLATMGVDVEQHMAAEKSDDGEQLNERKLDVLKFTVARFCENHEWHMVPEMRESDMQQKIKSGLNDVVDGIPPFSDDILNEKMHRESMEHSYRRFYRRDGHDTVPIHFPSTREQSTMCVKQLQQLARNMRHGENLPQEDVQEQLKSHMAQALDGGKLIVTVGVVEGKLQFLFGSGSSMARIVGVGLEFATVSWTFENVIVVRGITELEWTRLWGEVFLGKSKFENPVFMEKVEIFPADHEKSQGSHVDALSKVAIFFMIRKFLQNLDVGKVYNQVVRGVGTAVTEENQSDVGQFHANDGILGFDLWGFFSRLGLGSDTRNTSGEGGSHLGGTDIPREGERDEDGDGGEDGDNRRGKGADGRKLQQNNRRDVRVIVHPGSEHGDWNRNPVPEPLEGCYIDPTLNFLFKKTEKTIQSEILVKCCMNREGSCRNSERSGWFQKKIGVSFQCLERNGAFPSPSKLVGSENLMNSILDQTQTTSSQLTVGATLGYQGTGVSTSWTNPLAATLQSNTTEMASEILSGTRFRADCVDGGGPTPTIGYNFKLLGKIPTNKLPNGFDEEKFKGIFCTIYPNFKADWRVMEEKVCKYELKVKRKTGQYVLIPKKRKKQKLSYTCDKMLQTYMVTLFINHNMPNIATLAESELLWQDKPRNELVGLNVHPSSSTFHEASSSTQ